ncbi:unnamed protein product, partial [Heterosigma akashiwo]
CTCADPLLVATSPLIKRRQFGVRGSHSAAATPGLELALRPTPQPHGGAGTPARQRSG